MIINNVLFTVDLYTILSELHSQLIYNNIKLLSVLKDTPDNIQVQCPYHSNGQEKRPSAGIHKTDGMFHCFACQETHTLPELISYCFGKDDMIGSFGWNWLLKNFATIGVEERNDINLDFSRNNNTSRIYKSTANAMVSDEQLDSYRYYHPYMWKRKLTPEIIEIFDIGYDIDTECLTFPVKDKQGNCLFIARRSVNTKYFNYPSGAEKPLYGLYELYQLSEFPKEVIICESMLDALVFWTVNKYAIALNGLGNELQFKQLNSLPCRKFILCTDNDKAGMQARKRIKSKLNGKIISEYILPNNVKDANDCTKEQLLQLKELY